MGQIREMAQVVPSGPARIGDDDVREALRKGDRRAALSALMREHAPSVRRFCADMIGDPALAEDVAQITFANAFESLPTFAGETSARAWLLGIARHRCLDALKSRRRFFRVVPPDGEMPDVADPRANTEADMAARLVERAITDCMGTLAPAMRAAVGLRYRQNLSYDEMAEMTGERAGTLRVRVARALPLLRRCLEGKGVTP